MNLKIAIIPAMLSVAFAAPAFAQTVVSTSATNSAVGSAIESEPVASPTPGPYAQPINVTLTASGSPAIRYTLDSTVPSCSPGSGFVYSTPIPISQAQSILAISCYTNGDSSAIGAYTYSINASPTSGSGSSLAQSSAVSSTDTSASSPVSTTGSDASDASASSSLPGVPNTGAGGTASETLVTLIASAFIALSGAGLLAYDRMQRG